MSGRAPTWDLVVNDRLLPADYKALISSVAVSATVDGADELVIQATGWDDRASTYKILGETVLGVGNSVVVRGGYLDGDVVALQRFRLLREETNYQPGQRPSVRIRGYSAEHRLVEDTEPGRFEAGVRDSDIAILLAQKHGISTTATSVQRTGDRRKATIKEQGKTSWQFLQGLAHRNGYGPPFVRYDEDTGQDVLYFRATSLEHQADIGIATFVHNPHAAGSDQASGTLHLFSPKLSLAGVPTRVEVVGWDRTRQEAIRVTVEIVAGSQQTTVQTGDAVGKVDEGIQSGGQLQVTVLDKGKEVPETEKREAIVLQDTIDTTEDARAFAERWLQTRLEAFMQGRARLKGWPFLWVSQIHRFDGLAPHHNGLWEFTAVRHLFTEQGYNCSATVQRIVDESAAKPREV